MSLWPPAASPRLPLVVEKWLCSAVNQASLHASTASSASLSPCCVTVDRTARTTLTKSIAVGADEYWLIYIFHSVSFESCFTTHHNFYSPYRIKWMNQFTFDRLAVEMCSTFLPPYCVTLLLFHFCPCLCLLFRYSSNQRLSRAAQPDQLCGETRFPWWQYNRCPRSPYHQVPRWPSRCRYFRGHGSTWTSEDHNSK